MAEQIEFKAFPQFVCPLCGKHFEASCALGSHVFWKHEYRLWRAERELSMARGEPVMPLSGIRGLPEKRALAKPAWFKGKISGVVREGFQIAILE